jgi:hypothetical protein
MVATWCNYSFQAINYLHPGRGGNTEYLFRLGVQLLLCLYAEMLSMDFSSASNMIYLLLALQDTASLLQVVMGGVQRIAEHAKRKPSPAPPWIFGRPYLFRGHHYTFEHPHKSQGFSSHSGTTTRELYKHEHEQRMKTLLHAKGLWQNHYRHPGKHK